MASEIPVQSNNEVICNDVQITTGSRKLALLIMRRMLTSLPMVFFSSPSSQCNSEYSMIRLRDNGEINDDDMLLYCNHMTMLHTDMCERYADILSMTLPAWILDPFSSVDGADVFLQEELIELQANDELNPKLKNSYTQFWLQRQIRDLFPVFLTLGYCEFNGPISLDDAAGDASEVTADKDSSHCNLSIELGELDSASTSSEAGASSDDAIVCNGTVLANESEMDIVEGESREADLAKFENVFKEILACTVHNDDSAVEDVVADKWPYETVFDNIRKKIAWRHYEYEMQTDVQSEEPSFRPHTHEEALTVEPHEDDVEMLCLKAAVPSGRTHWKRMRSCS
uniref:Uncharacterized protein n=1 Tax=Trichuris muris TaxID=70415 RepID=A0A5S6QFR5_TRIMR